MHVDTATNAGHPGRPNEDFVGTAGNAIVVLDGAGIPGTEDLCRHGTAWYAQTLGRTLLAQLADTAPAEALAASIDHVAGLHRDTCDVTNVSSPQATVAAVRFTDDAVEYLVLADTYVVLADRVITDPREVDVRTECLATYDASSVVEAFRARRNQPGGYWIAKDDPRAAAEAVTGRVPLAGLDAVVLLSNGARELLDLPGLAERLRAERAETLLGGLRSEMPDDATVAFCDLLDRA